jgi:hypothetical protein
VWAMAALQCAAGPVCREVVAESVARVCRVRLNAPMLGCECERDSLPLWLPVTAV